MFLIVSFLIFLFDMVKIVYLAAHHMFISANSGV